MKLTPDERNYLRTTILTVVNDSYRAYRAARAHGVQCKEPNITVGVLFNEFNENRGWGPVTAPKYFEGNKYFTPARRRRELRKAVGALAETLRAQGQLLSSWGVSLKGKEARCYEPGLCLT